jgi:zinc protease
VKARSFAPLVLLVAAACGGAAPAPPVAAPLPVTVPKQATDVGAASTQTAPHADESFRQHPPERAAETPFVVPAIEHAQLRNGIPVVFAQLPSPHVAIYILARGGLADVGVDGVAVLDEMTTSLIRGTTNETTWALDDVYVSAFMPRPTCFWWPDSVVLKLVAPREKLADVVELAADMALHPSFDQKDFDRSREMDASHYERQANDGGVLAPNALRRAIYGAHPYGAVAGSPARTRAVTRAQAVSLHARLFDPGRLSVVVAGGVDKRATVDALDGAFGALQAHATPKEGVARPPGQPAGPRLVVVDVPGSAIANITMGLVGPSAAASDFEPAMVTSAVLIDAGVGRLPIRLRDQLGTVPWVSMWSYWSRSGGILGWNTRAPTDRVASVITESMRTVRDLAAQGPSDAELVWARDREVHNLASSFETAANTAGILALTVSRGQPVESIALRPPRYAQVTAATARDAAARYLDADKIRTVVAGDWAALREPLTALGLGPIEVRKADGTLVSVEGAHHGAATR